jgi:hypothetical protein
MVESWQSVHTYNIHLLIINQSFERTPHALIIILRNPNTDHFHAHTHTQKPKHRLFSRSSSETQEQIVFNLILILRNPRKDCFQPHPYPQKPEHRLFYLLKSSRRRKTEYSDLTVFVQKLEQDGCDKTFLRIHISSFTDFISNCYLLSQPCFLLQKDMCILPGRRALLLAD